MTEKRDDIIRGFANLLKDADENERKAYMARAQMLAVQEASPEAFEPPVRNLGQYIDTPIEIPPVLVEPGLLVRGSILCTVARAGFGKTQMNLNRMLKWASGSPMFPGIKQPDDTPVLAPTKPLKSLIIENEGAAGMFHKQLGIMLNKSQRLTPDERDAARENVFIWGDGGYSGLKLDNPDGLATVKAGCEKHEPDIVFIEPFRGLWTGDENSATDMAIVADALSELSTEYNCGVILTHHERKSGAGEDGEKMSAGRGSTVLEAVVATMENLEKAKGGDYREVSWSKVRYGGGYGILPVRMEWLPGEWWYRHVAPDEIEAEVLTALQEADPEPMSPNEIMDATGEKSHKVRDVLKKLVEDKSVGKRRRQPSGWEYFLTSSPGDGMGF